LHCLTEPAALIHPLSKRIEKKICDANGKPLLPQGEMPSEVTVTETPGNPQAPLPPSLQAPRPHLTPAPPENDYLPVPGPSLHPPSSVENVTLLATSDASFQAASIVLHTKTSAWSLQQLGRENLLLLCSGTLPSDDPLYKGSRVTVKKMVDRLMAWVCDVS
jgi:hypothetical protein